MFHVEHGLHLFFQRQCRSTWNILHGGAVRPTAPAGVFPSVLFAIWIPLCSRFIAGRKADFSTATPFTEAFLSIREISAKLRHCTHLPPADLRAVPALSTGLPNSPQCKCLPPPRPIP